ncbi:MAG: DUF3035 domain-containing protein [Pseudomonadota bacterium]
MATTLRTIIGLTLAAGALAACDVSTQNGSVGRQLGIIQGAPDEFLIIARNPIEIPASFDLPRPTPGAPSRVEVNPLADAHAALFQRRDPITAPTASQGEGVLLAGADAAGDNSEIRSLLDAETAPVGERQFGLTSLFGIPIPATITEGSEVVDKLDEVDELRAQGYPTPAAPPAPENRNTGIRYIEN